MKQLIRFALVTLAVGLAGCDNSAEPESSADETTQTIEVRSAIDVLEEAHFFADGGIGFSGVIPDVVFAFGVVLESDHADSLFGHLLIDASLAGQMYGLSGLYLVDHDEFVARVRAYSGVSERIEYWSGCETSQVPASELANTISEGDIPQRLEWSADWQ